MEDVIGQIREELLPSQAVEVYKTLAKVLGNIANNPNEIKFRTLKKENKIVAETLGRSKSAMQLLLMIGFQDSGSIYQCPMSADISLIAEACELVQCVAVSMESEVDAPPPSAPKSAAVATTPPAVSKPAPTAKSFARRLDADGKQREQADQLAAVRAARAGGQGGYAQPSAPAAPAAAAQPAVDRTQSGSKPMKSAFDFESRSKKEDSSKKAELSLAELRAQQKAKYQEFENDPNAKNRAEYQKPASVAGKPQEQSWGDWASSMNPFGGGSSSGSSNNKKPPPGGGGERRGPNIKGVGDLPKPVQRG